MIDLAPSVGSLDLALLDALNVLDASSSGPTVKTTRVLEAVDALHGIAPRYAYDSLAKSLDASLTHVRLFEGRGNFGSRDDPPANPRYTEVRMSPIGELVLRLHHSNTGALPIGFINGTAHLGGRRPAFDPHRVLSAVDRAASKPDVPDGELNELVSIPSFPTGCHVDGDIAVVWDGAVAMLRLGAQLTRITGERRPQIAITGISPLVGPNDVLNALNSRAYNERRLERYPQLEETMIPMSDLNDVSTRGETRLLITFDRGTNLDEVERKLLDVWAIATPFEAKLPKPVASIVRDYATGAADAVLAATAELRSQLEPA